MSFILGPVTPPAFLEAQRAYHLQGIQILYPQIESLLPQQRCGHWTIPQIGVSESFL